MQTNTQTTKTNGLSGLTHAHKARRVARTVIVVGMTAIGMWAPRPAVADTYFNVVDGNWSNKTSWGGGALPPMSDTVYIGCQGKGPSPQTCRVHVGDVYTNRINVGSSTGGNGSLVMDGGNLSLTYFTIGVDGGCIGTVVQTNGLITESKTLTVGSGASSRGTYTLAGYATNNCPYILNIANASSSTGTLIVQDSALFSNTLQSSTIGNAAGACGTLLVNGGTFALPIGGGLALQIGCVGTAFGTLVCSNGLANVDRVYCGRVSNTSTGIIVAASSGVVRISNTLHLGEWGCGELHVSDSASAQVGTMWCGENNGGTGIIYQTGGSLTVNDLRLGYNSGTSPAGYGELNVSGTGTTYLPMPTNTLIGYNNSGVGAVNLSSGGTISNYATIYFGYGSGSTGQLHATGGNILGGNVALGFNTNSVGRLIADGGGVTNSATLTLAANSATAQGSMWVQNGGRWYQQGALAASVGIASLTVSNGVMDVEPGTATIGNATSGSESVLLTGTQRTFRVNTLTINATGAITNHIASYADGIDITNGANTALGIPAGTTGDRIHLVFDKDPVAVGDYWGLRWAGNHTNDLATFTNGSPKRLTWETSPTLSPFFWNKVSIYTNGGYTYVGINVAKLPMRGTTVFFR